MILQKIDILRRQLCGTVRYWRSELAGGNELVGDGLDMVEGTTVFYPQPDPRKSGTHD